MSNNLKKVFEEDKQQHRLPSDKAAAMQKALFGDKKSKQQPDDKK